MKKPILALLLLVLLFAGCKKSDTQKSAPVVLLTKILDGDKIPLAEFTYDGKRLNKAVFYINTVSNVNNAAQNPWQEHDFVYDTQGKVIKVNISYSSSYQLADTDPSMATFTYDGDNIHQITFKAAVNGNSYSTVFTYQNNRVVHTTSSSVYNTADDDYIFDSNNNQILTNLTFPTDASRTGTYTKTNLTFDNNHSLASAVPYAMYFELSYFFEPMFLAWNPGPNNVLTDNYESTDFKGQFTASVYKYVYDSNGYPSQVTVIGYPYNSAYFYQYITAN
jgi:hypothetical protein